MSTNDISDMPHATQAFTSAGDKCNVVWFQWFFRMKTALAKFLPPLGSANQILGVNAAGTANEYKTLTDGNGIDISHSAGAITITVNQMELANVLAYAARH